MGTTHSIFPTRLQAGDTLILFTSEHLTAEQAEKVREQVRQTMPGLSDVVIIYSVSGFALAGPDVTQVM